VGNRKVGGCGARYGHTIAAIAASRERLRVETREEGDRGKKSIQKQK
jgi:hypothetical protein